MNIVSYGGGTNSTALLIECVNRSIPIDLILFADTGGEKPHTYKYLKMFSKWCVANGLPEITTVQQVNQNGTYITLEQHCLNYRALPSIAYGFKGCSQKHKLFPQNKYMNNWPPAQAVWAEGGKIMKFIGYDADESRRVKDFVDEKYNTRHPLIEWDMGREECIQSIKQAGLELPGKSSCYFCPSSRISEILELKDQYPALMDRAVAMEKNADLTKVKGLGRSFAWGDLIKQEDAFGYELPPEIDCGCYDG